MNKAAIAMTFALAVGIASGVSAREMTGTIKSVDKKADSITLSDGKTYKLPEGVEVESLKVGEGVRITYSISSGRTHVSNVQPAPAGQ